MLSFSWQDADDSDRKRFKIIADLLSGHICILEFLFSPTTPCLNYPEEDILNNIFNFSNGQQVLLKVALSIWSGHSGALSSELIYSLDDANFQKVIAAMAAIRQL